MICASIDAASWTSSVAHYRLVALLDPAIIYSLIKVYGIIMLYITKWLFATWNHISVVVKLLKLSLLL